MDAQALGRYLRQSREAKELTLEDAEQATRIRKRILESFELGDFNIADISVIQVRGFIRNYAGYLGLDEDKMVQYYEAARLAAATNRAQLPGGKYANRPSKKKKRDTQPTAPAPVAARSITDTDPALPAVNLTALAEARKPKAGLFTILLRLLVAGAALAVIVFVVVQLTEQPTQPTDPAADILGALPPSPTFTPAPTMTESLLLPTPSEAEGVLQAYTGEGVLVTLVTTQRTWLRIITDGVQQYAGIATPNTHMEIPASQTVSLTASNAEALEVVWNGQPQGSFGGRGQLVEVVFTETDVQISSGPGYDPTSPFTPTPLPTDPVNVESAIEQLTPSDTPGPSPTPTLTETPTLTATITETPTNTIPPTETPVPSGTPTPIPVPTDTPIPTDTIPPTVTPTPTVTASPTQTPTLTLTPTNTLIPTATAILPPRVTPENPTPTKDGA